MYPVADFLGESQFRSVAPRFWERFLSDESVSIYDDLQKLVAGCELIALVDDADLLNA